MGGNASGARVLVVKGNPQIAWNGGARYEQKHDENGKFHNTLLSQNRLATLRAQHFDSRSDYIGG